MSNNLATKVPLHYCRPGQLAPGLYESFNDLGPFTRMAEMGANLVQVNATPTFDIYYDSGPWLAPDAYDYRVQEEGWKRLLESCPEARLCLRIFLGSPPWWDEAHPEELQLGADGSPLLDLRHSKRLTVPSVASEKWREDCGKALRHFLEWLAKSGWSERVWGFLVCSGITFEWGLLGGENMPDASAPMVRRFRRYLREIYPDEDALRVAWDDAEIGFENAAAPSRQARLRADGDFRSFPRDRAAYDFQRCLSLANAEWLLDSGRIIREFGEPHYQIGTFYGYTLTAREGEGWSVRAGAGGFAGGHHAFAKVLREKVFDYIASPYAYGARDLGRGSLLPHFPWASVSHHGAESFLENDLWTLTNPRVERNKLSVGETFTVKDSILHQRLAWGTALCRGESLWWFDLTHSRFLKEEVSNYSDPAIHEELARQFAAFESLSLNRGGNACQIALVIDEAGKDALALGSKLFLHEVYHALTAWSWCGAPFDVWLAEDATPETMKPYKLVYLFAPLTLPPLQAQLQKALVSSGRVLWLAPGTDLPGADARASVLRLSGGAAGKSAGELAQVAAGAGVHLYGKAPLQIWASQNLVVVHCDEQGRHEIRFPGAGKWREFFSGEMWSDEFVFEKNDVRLFQRVQEEEG